MTIKDILSNVAGLAQASGVADKPLASGLLLDAKQGIRKLVYETIKPYCRFNMGVFCNGYKYERCKIELCPIIKKLDKETVV